ncbi:cadherin-like beta sandwich domain-containing protein [Cohnella nanjingensis]|uniref:Cadherin-like beta sandwich domain-containing protein n=1 Tax=Cohnella nanjingensis TaxID=1387779 RepID=A0A7X0RSV7_9BACL|nr:cadherin-like beta sandwich domain-containing protein [Cohnella nanjingensis]MBB6672965.1 cadherin-like beta sandwich domain-containing protein [Cohnella nanjingensis]
MAVLLVAGLLVFASLGLGAWTPDASAASTWAPRTSGHTNPLYAADYGGGQFLATGSQGDYSTSPDGTTWTKQTVPGASNGATYYTALYTGTSWILAGIDGKITTSPNAAPGSWTARTSAVVNRDLWGSAYGAGKAVVVGWQGTILVSSDDGASWTNYGPAGVDFNSVAYNGSLFVAVGDSGKIYTSTNAATWTLQTSGTGTNLFSLTYGRGLFVAVGESNQAYTSTDGIAWTPRTLPGAVTALYGITFGGNKFSAAGPGGVITVSGDGIAWTTETSGTTSALNGIKSVHGKVIALGDSGTLLTQDLDANANLSALSISSGTLTPNFNSATISYTASVGNATNSITVTPTSADVNASITVNGTAVISGAGQSVFLNTGSNTISVVVTAQDGLSTKTYTLTVTRAASSNANLSGLSISSGTLTPVFSAGTTSYTASVGSSVTSIDVTPTIADSNATVKVNGSATASGSARTVPLIVGSNTVTILVTAQDGNTIKSYTIDVTRAAPLSSNADLSNLTLSAGTLSPAFASGTTSYTASVANGVSNVDVTSTVADGTATVKINGTAVASGSAYTVALNVGANTITVLVTAQDGTTQNTYTITATRAASANADLNNLTINQGTLSPGFASGTPDYTASVGNSVTNLNVTPYVADSTATVTINGDTVISGNAKNVALNVGPNTIMITVTAQDGTTRKTYTITATRAASANADLSNLTINQGTLSPGFASGTSDYTASVGNSVTNVDVTPYVADSTATVKVDGSAAISGNAKNVALNVGPNTITVLVTAQDGTTEKTYSLTVTRAASANADLSNLVISQSTLSPTFAADTTAYTASVGNSVTSLDVTPYVADSTATVRVAGSAITSGNAKNIALDVGPNTITVLVTAQDGTTEKTYSLTVTRAASANADLSNLTISQGTLSPAFASGTTTYTASVGNSAASLDVTPTVADGTATVKVNGSSVSSGNAKNVALAVGPNTINVLVTAQDGTTQQSYTITVTRSASAQADLSDLTISKGLLSPSFESGTTAYTASVANSVYSLDVTPTAADSTATIKINGDDVASGSAKNVALAVGPNTINVLVTAQDGTTQQSYTITVTRSASAQADLSDLTISKGLLSPSFESGTTAYTASVANSVYSLDVTATAADTAAAIKINGDDVPSGAAKSIALNDGVNSIVIEVTAQDGSTRQSYTINVTREQPASPPGSTPPPTTTVTTTVEVKIGGIGGGSLVDIFKRIGISVKFTAEIHTNSDQKLNLADAVIFDKGTLQLRNVPAGTYTLILNVIAPNGQKLAGQRAVLIVDAKGSASLTTELIDPFGIVTDSLTGQPIAGATATLYWADTDLNRSKNRTPGTAVSLPELPDMTPNQNHNPQVTTAAGEYGWMVYPDGDYYMIAEKNGYVVYDSRKDLRNEQQGDSSYIRNGIIHVGQTIVQMDYAMDPNLADKGTHSAYISGYGDGTFKPNRSLTRAELATILARIIPDGTAGPSAAAFKDVPAAYWAKDAISKLSSLSIVNGYPDGTFHPNAPVTRAELASLLIKIKKLDTSTAGKSSFTDIGKHWARAAIVAVESLGYVSGYSDDTFRPNQAVTRAEAVKILNRALGRSANNQEVDSPWKDISTDFWAYKDILEASVTHDYSVPANGTGNEYWTSK